MEIVVEVVPALDAMVRAPMLELSETWRNEVFARRRAGGMRRVMEQVATRATERSIRGLGVPFAVNTKKFGSVASRLGTTKTQDLYQPGNKGKLISGSACGSWQVEGLCAGM